VLSPEHLEVTTQSLIAILGVWLGLTVLTRFRTPPARVFSFLSLTLALWASSIIVQRLSTSETAVQVGHGVEELTTGLILPAAAHLSLVIATEGRPSRRQLWLLALGYALNIAFALPGALDRSAPIAISAPQLALGPVPAVVLGWSRLGARLATILVSVAWLLLAFRQTAHGDPRRRQLGVTLAAVAVAGVGGAIRLVSEVSPTDPWVGLSLVGLAMILSASVVFSPGFFFAPEVAGRAFWTSLGLGLALFLLVGTLLVVEDASRRFLGLDLPLLTIIALVVTIAVYEPATGWARARLGGRSPSLLARRRLLAALGQPSLHPRAADAGVQPALRRVTRALDLAGAVVVRPDGSIAASDGHAPDPTTSLTIPLFAQNEHVGELRVGSRLSGLPLSSGDQEVVRLSAAYVAEALRTGQREDEQVEALSDLSRDRASVDSAATDLLEALVRRSVQEPGLHVYSLGPLRAERDGRLVERWGGEKAGSRQALGLFAFLFDRGEHGVAKDEALDLIWPDTDVERADLAFHRTLGGLRHTLDRSRDGGRRAIRFHNDRYRLDPTLIAWSDVATFEENLDRARAATEAADALRLLEAARALYRGEYLDDCPFYGDSVFVDDRRASLRARFVDLLVALGERYESGNDRASAAAVYREAVAIAVDGCGPAEAGLLRLAASR
jgi:DNA-binding winged helix-turn-helix (wHTH) protein